VQGKSKVSSQHSKSHETAVVTYKKAINLVI